MSTHVSTRQRLESQQQENIGVQREFDSLAEDANVYKLIGPVLLKQEKTEAVLAVKGRLEFIEGEIKRVEKLIQETQDKTDGKRMEVYLRTHLQLYLTVILIQLQIMKIQSQMEGPQGGQQAQVGA